MSAQFGPGTMVAQRLRVTRTTANLPQTTQTAMFTITGAIRMISLVGRITTVIGGAVNYRWVANPTTGADTDLCANADINAQPAGTILTMTGVLATALQISANEGALPDQAAPVIVQPGSVDAVTDASRTGQVELTLTYEAITSDGLVVAA